jgi:hypothetical protein
MTSVNRMTPAERRGQDEIMAVAIANRGGADPKLESALGRLCALHKPYALGEHLYEAGLQYRNIVREHLNAWGFRVHGWGPSDRGYTEQTDQAARARRDLADKRLAAADKVLNALAPRHPGVVPKLMVGLCYDGFHPQQVDILRRGLMALSDFWGMTPRRSWE